MRKKAFRWIILTSLLLVLFFSIRYLRNQESFSDDFFNSRVYKVKLLLDDSYDDVVEEGKTTLTYTQVKKTDNGLIYELNISNLDEVERFPIYIYVKNKEIYRINLESEAILQAEERDILKSGNIIYKEKNKKQKRIEGVHEEIEYEEGIITSHFYVSDEYGNSKGFWESFTWGEDFGLIRYKSGYNSSAEVIELNI